MLRVRGQLFRQWISELRYQQCCRVVHVFSSFACKTATRRSKGDNRQRQLRRSDSQNNGSRFFGCPKILFFSIHVHCLSQLLALLCIIFFQLQEKAMAPVVPLRQPWQATKLIASKNGKTLFLCLNCALEQVNLVLSIFSPRNTKAPRDGGHKYRNDTDTKVSNTGITYLTKVSVIYTHMDTSPPTSMI